MSTFVPKTPTIDAITLPCDMRIAIGESVSEIDAKAGDVLAVVYGRVQVWDPKEFEAKFKPSLAPVAVQVPRPQLVPEPPVQPTAEPAAAPTA